MLALPADRPRPPVPSLAGHGVPLEIQGTRYRDLAALAREHGVTVFMVLQAALAAGLRVPADLSVIGMDDVPAAGVGSTCW